MNHSLNEPGTDRPPATADIAPPGIAEVEPQTRIGKLTVPTAALRAYTMVIALIAIWIFFYFMTDGIFLEARNFSNLMRQTAVTGVLAVGMLMVIVTGQIDLSVGSVVGLAGGIAAAAASQSWLGWGIVPSLAVAIAVGIVIGALQGALVAYANIPAFIVTLGGLLAWRGAIKGISQGNTIPIDLQGFKAIGQCYIEPLAGYLIAAGAVISIIWLTMKRNRARQRYGLSSQTATGLAVRILAPSAIVAAFIYVMNSYIGVPIPVIIFLAVALV
ncbi:MAG TPA: hypothetical protein VFQ92_16915, partial [Blastocatellia bacterium]|nr:hypothetical protein [Blastocatellia bacterium]